MSEPDPGRAALIRYLADCMRAELRARQLYERRQERVKQAIRQIQEYDEGNAPTAEQVLAKARMVKRLNVARRRAA